MNTPAKKPREFWIETRTIGDDTFETVLRYLNESDKEGCIHVIEYSAYQSLLEQAESLERALELVSGEERHSTAGKRCEIAELTLEQFRAFKKKAGKE